MIKLYLNNLIVNFILTRKIFIIVLAFIAFSFLMQIYFDNDTSISAFLKGLVISSLILNISLLIFGFKSEESTQYKCLSIHFDLNDKHRIIVKYLFFLLINSLLMIGYLWFDYYILLVGFLINMGLTTILLFVYFNFGIKYLSIVVLIIMGLTMAYLQAPFFLTVNIFFNEYISIAYAFIVYTISLIVTLFLNQNKWFKLNE